MIGFSFRKGKAFDLDGASYCIRRTLEDGAVVLENMETGHFLTRDKQQLLVAYAAGSLVAPHGIKDSRSVPARCGRPLQDFSDSLQREAIRRKRYLDSIFGEPATPLSKVELVAAIRSTAELLGDSNPPSMSSLYRWRYRFLATNDVRSLIPQYSRRGPTRPRALPIVVELFFNALADVASMAGRWDMNDVAVRLRTAIGQENRLRDEGAQLKMPSCRTLHRWWSRMDRYDVSCIADGVAEARKKYRVVRQSVSTSRILERVEIDHTPMDVFVVDDETLLPCGRPTLTVLIDHYSRMPIGYHMSFGGPSISAVLAAMRHAILPKEPMNGYVPNLSINHAWPCYGLFDLLVADNGVEFHGDALDQACLLLNTKILYCPARQPRFKGTIERFLKTINYGFAHKLPGTSLAKFSERGSYDPLKHAVLTLGELKHVFEKWLLDVYAQTPHRGLQAAPYEIWQQGAAQCPPYLPATTLDLIPVLGVPVRRAVRHDGVMLHSLLYRGGALWQIARAYGIGVSVRVVYDPEDLGKILVWMPNSDESFVVHAVLYEYANGLTLNQHRMIRALSISRFKNSKSPADLMRAKAELADAIRGLMGTRSLRLRKSAARTHGASSVNPEKRFNPQASKVESTQQIGGEQKPMLKGVKLVPRIPYRSTSGG